MGEIVNAAVLVPYAHGQIYASKCHQNRSTFLFMTQFGPRRVQTEAHQISRHPMFQASLNALNPILPATITAPPLPLPILLPLSSSLLPPPRQARTSEALVPLRRMVQPTMSDGLFCGCWTSGIEFH